MSKEDGKKDISVVFSDLEGTLLREEDGDFDPQQFQSLIGKIHTFLSQTSTELKFVIVSPIESKYMVPLLDKLDDEFHAFNKEHNTRYKIDVAACYKESDTMDNLPNNILPILDDRAGKKRVVDYLTDSLGYRFNIMNTIYMGNGRNDVDSIDFLRSKYKDHAFTICPQNSRNKLKANPKNYIGEETDLSGLNNGFDKLLSDLNMLEQSNPDDHDDHDDR